MAEPITEEIRIRLAEGETEERFLVEGRHAVRALIESGAFEIEAIVSTGNRESELFALADERRLPVSEISREEAAGLLGFAFHRGVLAVVRKPETSFAVRDAGSSPKRLVILDNLSDPGNVGTVIRNAAAFGFDAVVCSRSGASPFNAKAVRASGTGIFQVPVHVEEKVIEAVTAAWPEICLVGTVASPEGAGEAASLAAEFREGKEPPPFAILLGGEASGLSPEALAACHRLIHIPISERVESLNVASASAIVLHALGQVPD